MNVNEQSIGVEVICANKADPEKHVSCLYCQPVEWFSDGFEPCFQKKIVDRDRGDVQQKPDEHKSPAE